MKSQRQRRRFSTGTGNFWITAALVLLSLSLQNSSTTAMTFTNKRTRGYQQESNDIENDSSREQQQQQQRRRPQKKNYSYENCPWSADQTIQHHFISIFDTSPSSSYMTQSQRRQQKAKQKELEKISYPALNVMFPPRVHGILQQQHGRHLEDANAAADDAYQAANDDAAQAAADDYYQGDDDANANNNKNNNDDSGKSYDDDIFTGDNEMCSQFLVNFLEGTTDARDTCEGIQNAYVAAGTLHDSYGMYYCTI
jgi:hypothetical protein